MAPITWPLLKDVLEVDPEPLDLALGRQLRMRTIVLTCLGFDLPNRRLPLLEDGNYSKHQPLELWTDETCVVRAGEKFCVRCRRPHPLALFSKSSTTKDGLGSWCKPCVAQYDKGRPRARKGARA